jgi:hypothetical protein
MGQNVEKQQDHGMIVLLLIEDERKTNRATTQRNEGQTAPK